MPIITLSQARQNAINRRLNAVKRSASPTQGAEIAQYSAQTQLPAQQENPQNNGGFLGGVGYTLGKAGTGALRGLEGIWDFVAGGIADLFGADEWAEEQLTTSPFDEWNEELDAWYNPSGVMEFVGDVAGGVGQMLPSIAVSAIPYVGPALSTGMFVTSAAGMGVSEAAKESGELGAKEWLYGAGSGAVEGAIEKLSGGIGGTKLGTVLGKQVAKSTGGKLAATFVGEGLEEVASDLIDPALRRVTGVDPDATVDVSQLPNTFLVGGTAGALLGGGSRLVNAKRAGGFNNLNAMEDANAIREARARGNTLQAEGRLTDSWADTLSKSEQEAAKRLSTRLQRMNADTRSQFIVQNNLGDMFDANGALVENTVVEPQEYNRDAISYSARNLVGRTDENGNSVLKYAPTQNAVREDIAQAAKDIAKLSNGDSRYVVVDTLTVPESGQKANAFYDNETGIMYIANDADMGDARSFVVSHEYVHSLEGSGQYSKYANEVLAEIAQSPEYRKKYNYDEYYARYKDAHPNVQEETLNYIVETEMVADFTAKEILTNESAIRRLANRDASLVRRIYEWVKEKIRRLTSGGGSRENVAYLRRAEKLLAKAMDEPGGGISISEMDEYVREENARRNRQEADAEAEAAEAGEARRLADVRMSVQEVDGKPIVVIDTDQDIFEGVDSVDERRKIARKYILENFRNKDYNTTDDKIVEITRKGVKKFSHTGNKEKLRLSTELGNLIETGEFDHSAPNEKNINPEYEHFDYYKVDFILDDVGFSAVINIGVQENGRGYFYDITKIQEKKDFGKQLRNNSTTASSEVLNEGISRSNSPKREGVEPISSNGNTSTARAAGTATGSNSASDRDVSTNSIRDNTENVKRNGQKSDNPDIRYSLSSSFAEQVDDVLDGADTNSTHLYVCETPEILRQAGLPDLPVLMTAKHLKSITNKAGKSKGNYHDLGRDLVKRLPELLARPAMIMDSNSRPDSVVVVTTAVDKENRPVIAAIKVDGNGYINDVQISANVMTSSYGKDNFQNFLETALQENRLLYWNKKRSQEIFKIPGLQLPDNLENLNSDTIIRKTSAKVNTSGQNFSGRYSVSAERPARDENYVNNRLKSYTYSDVDKIVENLTINKYGDDVVLRHKGNIGRQIYSMLNEASLRNRRAEAEKIARRIVYQELAAQTLLNAEEIENARRNGIEISETWIDKKLSSQLSSSENEAFVRELRDELLNAFETTGKLNDAGKMYLRYKDMSDRLRTVIAKEGVLKTARKLKKKNYPLAFDGFDSVKKALSKIEYRSDINKSSTRDIVSAFSQFYTAQNEALDGYYSNEVREAIDNFLNYNGTGDLDLYELEQLNTVLQAADHLLRTYDKAFLNDRTISVTKTANEEIATVKENAPVYGYTPLGRKGVLGQALRSIVDMRTLMRWIDGGKSGVMSELFEQLAHGSTVQTVTVMDLNKDFEKFIKSHKKFYKELDKDLTFKYNGTDAEITRAEAISLYLTALQEDGLYHLAFGGFAVNDGRDTVRRYYGKKPFYGQQEDVDAYEREVLREIKADMNALYEQFNEAEKEYIGIARDLFNNKAKKIKQDVDMKRMGITNARVDNYFPMRVYERGAGAQKPAQGFIQELNLIANQSIHKDRVKGSKQTLLITPVNTVIMNHIRQIAMYNAYAIPLDTFRRVLNKNVSVRADGKTDTAHAVTLKTTIQEDAWADFAKFIEKFEMDVQGAQVRTDTFDRIFRWMRSNYAKFQLGLNIKTMASQLTSLPMVGGRVGWGNLLKGTFAKPNISEMFEYSEWARARAYEGAAYKSQALVDNLDTIGQLAMKPIGWVDMFTMNRIYNAAKYYIASRDGVSLNSVECKTKAAEMLEELGRQTQNNSEVAERSAVMRSGNEIMKSVVMFSSDAMKQFSTLVQAFDKISFIKQKLKRGIGNAEALRKELSAARREARQALASVASSMTFYVLMGMLINYGLFAKEPEDDETMVTIFLKNLGGSVTGMIPIVRELYSFFVEGYELDNFAYDTFNGLTSAVKNMFDLFARAGSGERVTNQEWMLAMRKFIYAAGQVTGLPTRNIYNQMYGLIKRFSPSAAYEINSMFYGASTGDLTKAIEKGDVSLATTVTQELLAGKGIDASESVAEEFARLYAEGYSLPRGIPESVTVDDEEVVLNARQAGIVLDKYAEASVQAEGLVNSQEFAALDDNGKADALRLLFNYYYYAGVNEATGAYADNRTLLLGEAIDISKVAAAYGQLSELKADTDRTGNAIAGTKKAKVQRVVNGLRLTAAQKYILMGFLGYKNANGENTVKSYIRSLGLSEEGQLALLEMCGYDASSK